MPTPKSLDQLLAAASRILDHVAAQIQDTPLKPTKEYIGKIGQALTLIFEIQQEIYRLEPSLEPDYLKQPPPYTGEGREFGDVIIHAADCEEAGDYHKAIAAYQEYIAQGPPEFFANMARNQIERIKKQFNV
jgi:hypothetical protein